MKQTHQQWGNGRWGPTASPGGELPAAGPWAGGGDPVLSDVLYGAVGALERRSRLSKVRCAELLEVSSTYQTEHGIGNIRFAPSLTMDSVEPRHDDRDGRREPNGTGLAGAGVACSSGRHAFDLLTLTGGKPECELLTVAFPCCKSSSWQFKSYPPGPPRSRLTPSPPAQLFSRKPWLLGSSCDADPVSRPSRYFGALASASAPACLAPV